jgi:hypothetical protein
MRELFVLLLTVVSLSVFAGQRSKIKLDKNVPADVQDRMLEDLNFLYNVNLTDESPLHKKIFGTFKKSASYKSFFETRIKSVGFDEDPSNTATAYVHSFYLNKMFFAKNFVKFSVPQVSRVSVMYHEARHTELSKLWWSHVECPTPFIGDDGKEVLGEVSGIKLEGKDACDTTELGAYALGGILLNNISRFCENCNEKVKMDADFYGDAAAKRIIDINAKKKLKRDFGE